MSSKGVKTLHEKGSSAAGPKEGETPCGPQQLPDLGTGHESGCDMEFSHHACNETNLEINSECTNENSSEQASECSKESSGEQNKSSKEHTKSSREHGALAMSSNMAARLGRLGEKGGAGQPPPATPRESRAAQATKQVFAPLYCLPRRDSPVAAFVLSAWDDVVGPQTLQAWRRARPRRPQGGENHANASASCREYKEDATFTSSPVENGVNTQSTEFTNIKNLPSVIQYVTEHTVSLSQLSQRGEALAPTELHLPQHRVVVHAVRFVVEEETPVPHCLSLVAPACQAYRLQPLRPLLRAHLARLAGRASQLLQQTALPAVPAHLTPPLAGLCRLLASLHTASLAALPLLPCPPPDARLEATALTAHLTAGTTVVVGSRASCVNKAIMWLAQFVPPAALPLCRLCVARGGELVPGLVLQGVSAAPPAGPLLAVGRPVAVLCLDSGSVRLSVPSAAPGDPVCRPHTRVAAPVRRFLAAHRLLAGASAAVRRGHASAFLRSLRYQALAAVAWRQRGAGGRAGLKEALALDDPGLDLVLAMAEELRPGVAEGL